MTPLPKRGFGPPLVRYVFHPPLGLSALFFLYKNPRQSRPEDLLEGSKNFWESAFSGTFSSPHTFCTPPYHGPIKAVKQPLLQPPPLKTTRGLVVYPHPGVSKPVGWNSDHPSRQLETKLETKTQIKNKTKTQTKTTTKTQTLYFPGEGKVQTIA